MSDLRELEHYLTKMSSEISDKPVKSEIKSTPLFDKSNRWKEFLCIEKLDEYAMIPTHGSEGAAGYDLYAFDSIVIPAGENRLVPTKIKIHLPHGVYGRIAPRSSMSKNNIEVGAGVIDPDYRGEIMVLLRNLNSSSVTINKKDRIAQLILEQYKIVPIKHVTSVDLLFGPTNRGEGGFGSTGK
jgi:dUTP pyrophosphatase